MTQSTEAERADDDWYSWEFSGYPTRQVKVLEPCRREPAAPVPQDVVREALQCIHDTFKRDLDLGFATKDKQFAVDVASQALAAAPQPPDAFQTADGFELWWADHMPNATQSDAWNSWVTLHYYTKSQD